MTHTIRRDNEGNKVPENKRKKIYKCKCEYCQYLERRKLREQMADEQIKENQ